MAFPLVRCLLYDQPSVGKSTFAATFPKPMLVSKFDRPGKEMPYLRRGRVIRDAFDKDLGIRVTDVVSKKSGDLIVRVEHYDEFDPEHPVAYDQYLTRMTYFHKEFSLWATYVFDSITFFEMAARWHDEFRVNKNNPDPRAPYGGSARAVERTVCGRVPSLPMNVVAIGHTNHKKSEVSGRTLYYPAAPGKQPRNVLAAFSEIYRPFFSEKDNQFYVQTRMDGLHYCQSQLQAPPLMGPNPTYQMIFDNYVPDEEAAPSADTPAIDGNGADKNAQPTA